MCLVQTQLCLPLRTNSDYTRLILCTVDLEEFANLRKATICILLSVCPSVHIELGSHWTYFHETLYLDIFRKHTEKIQV
jgi:hypothetical protein